MGSILSAVVSLFAFRFRSRASLEIELIAVRHQLAVLRRQRPDRPQLKRTRRRSIFLRPTRFKRNQNVALELISWRLFPAGRAVSKHKRNSTPLRRGFSFWVVREPAIYQHPVVAVRSPTLTTKSCGLPGDAGPATASPGSLGLLAQPAATNASVKKAASFAARMTPTTLVIPVLQCCVVIVPQLYQVRG
jgi:hypothetical protein